MILYYAFGTGHFDNQWRATGVIRRSIDSWNLGSKAYSRESVSGQNREKGDHDHRTHPLTNVRDAAAAVVIAYDLGPIVLNRYAAQSCTHHASLCVVGNTLGAVVDIYRRHRFCAVALSGVLLIQRLWRRTSRRRLRGQRWVVVNGLEALRAAQRAVRRSARLLATPARALQSARLAARWLAERGLATIGRPLQIRVRRRCKAQWIPSIAPGAPAWKDAVIRSSERVIGCRRERNSVRVIPLDAKCFMDA